MTKRFCNKCGKEIESQETGLNFKHHFGYGSKYDFDNFNIDLCCECTDELVDMLVSTCKYNPLIEE